MKTWLIIAIIIIAIVAIAAVCIFKPIYVKLELVANIQNKNIDVNEATTDFRSEIHWWFIDAYPDSDYMFRMGHISPAIGDVYHPYSDLKKWGIDFDELGIDFKENNVVLSFSREIVKMKFNRQDWFPYRHNSTVKTVMSKNYMQNTIYIYKIPKYEISLHPEAFSDAIVER